MSEQNEQPTTDLLDENNRKDYQASTPPKKPGIIAGTLGKLALVSAAVGVGLSGTRGVTENPIQPIKDVASISREIKDVVVPKLVEQNQNNAPVPTSEPHRSVGEEAVSAYQNLTELNKIFDTFVDDLKKIPASKMLGMQGTGVEGYKVAIGDETIKFMRKPSETSHDLDEITVEIASDDETKTYTIKGNEISYNHKYNHPNHAEQESPPVNKSTGELLIDELNGLYQEWLTQRAQNGELITSSTFAKPTQETTPAPTFTPTDTPEPTPTPTVTPTPFVPSPLNRDIQETSSQPTSPESTNTTEEISALAPPNPPIEVQSSQPIAVDSTVPRSDL